MRISTIKSDKGYKINAYDYKVSLDGKIIDTCFTADDKLGLCLCYGPKDHRQHHRILKGKVVIYPPESD